MRRNCIVCRGTTAAGTPCTRSTCTTGPYCWQHLRKEEFLRVKKSTIPGAGLGLFADKPGAKKGEVVFSNAKKTSPEDKVNGLVGMFGNVHNMYLSEKQHDKLPGRQPYSMNIESEGVQYYLNPNKSTDGAAIRANDAGKTAQGWDRDRARRLNQCYISQNKHYTRKNTNPNIKDRSGKKLDKVLIPLLQLAPGRPGNAPRVIKQGDEIFTHYNKNKEKDKGEYWKSGNSSSSGSESESDSASEYIPTPKKKAPTKAPQKKPTKQVRQRGWTVKQTNPQGGMGLGKGLRPHASQANQAPSRQPTVWIRGGKIVSGPNKKK